MQYLIGIAIAAFLIYWLFSKVLIPLFLYVSGILGRITEAIIVFFQWTLWTTGFGNFIVASFALLGASVLLYVVYKMIRERLDGGKVYDQVAVEGVLSHAIAEYKKSSALPLAFQVGSKQAALVIRILLLVGILAASVAAVFLHIRQGTIGNPIILSTLGLGTAMSLYLGISFTIDARKVCPKSQEDVGQDE